MSVDIASQVGPETFVSNSGWAFMLEFAAVYGWRATGTLPPPGYAEWDGRYDPPQSQSIAAADAKAFADALMKGLEASDRFETSSNIARKLTEIAGNPIKAFEFRPGGVEHLRKFADIARMGPFVIT